MTIEELQEQMLKMQEDMQKIKTENDNLNKLVEEKTKREKELEEHNQKLFLRVTTKVNDEEEKVDEEKEYKEYVGEEFYNSLNKKEKDLLKTILEGDD